MSVRPENCQLTFGVNIFKFLAKMITIVSDAATKGK